MKYLLVIFLLSINAYSQQPICDENGNPIVQFANDISLPNCLQSKYLDPAINENNVESLCNECKTKFQNRYDKTIGEIPKPEKQAKFIEGAFNEYKKQLTESLIESLKLRSLRPTGSKFSKSINSCKMKSTADFTNGCKSKAALDFLKSDTFLKGFSDSIQTELAKMLSEKSDFSPTRTLLKRNNPSCFIPEKDILFLSVSATEESLSPQLINALGALDPKKYNSLDEILLDESVSALYAGDVSELIDSLKSHPLIAEKFNSPASLISFFKSVKDPKALGDLRNQIYNAQHGDDFDQRLSVKCEASFKALKESICSENFESGSISLNPIKNYKKIFNKELITSKEELANSEDLEKKNVDLLKLCEPKNSKFLNFSSVSSLISKGLNPLYSDQSFDEYKTFKHEKDIGQVNDSLCQNKNRNCSEQTLSCKLLQKYQDYLKPDSVESRLANSSNKEVNELLRSMIGDTSRIDSKTKEILIAQGIIPKDDGTMTAQADIPERQPDFAQKEAQQAQASATITPGKTSAAASSKQSASRNPASDNSIDEGYSSSNTRSASATLPDFSDLMDDQQELRGIQDEIKRRLLGMPENKPASKEEAKKLVRDSFKSRKRNLTPEMEDAFATRLMQPQAAAPQTASASNFANPQTNPENRAQVSGGESAQQKWKNSQDQKALMGMKGAQDVLNKENSNTQAASSESKPKELTKVALNIAEDPQVRLSDLFNKKIDQNDSETQLLKVLLRNKNNFLLQIKSMNFKIIFDEKNNFNVLLESGDRSEADRIRPQLELFLKKLKP